MSTLNYEKPTTRPMVEATESKFNYEQLSMLNNPLKAYSSPLAVIALVDMNAFFAQCEQIRLGCTVDDPVVCCQWASLIAVSYAARKYGIGRMDTLKSARDKCPNLVVGHAAVFKKGESHWSYLDGLPDQASCKVSLDPYRRESRKVFKILSRECDLVEKASVDECYMDLGRLVYSRLIDLFPFLQTVTKNETLPRVPDELPHELFWEGKVFQTAHENSEAEANSFKEPDKRSASNEVDSSCHYAKIKDWDDVCMMLGSQILLKIRREIFQELKYTTSAGLASTKTVAKLAAGFLKPDYQTIIRPAACYSFLHEFELSDVTQMGGQTGERILQKLGPPQKQHSITHIRENWTLQDITEEFPNEPSLASRIYEICRGTFHQDLKHRTMVKHMMSRKNFLEKNPVKTVGDCYEWIKVFVGDLYGRLIELDDENLNLSMSQKSSGEKERIFRPRTVSIQLTTSTWSKSSRQTQIPVTKDLDKLRMTLEMTAFRLLCKLLENMNFEDRKMKYRTLQPNNPTLKKIDTPSLANMSVVISNFITTSDANLIDSYGSITTNQAEIEPIDLPNSFHMEKQELPAKGSESTKAQKNNSYITKLFKDFQNEQNQATENHKEKSKLKNTFKEDKEYVKKMFQAYETSRMTERASSEEYNNKDTKRKTNQTGGKQDESVVVKSKKLKGSSKPSRDSVLMDMMKTQRCSLCNIQISDVFEHRDYHLALELSSKLNGPSPTKNSSQGNKKNSGSQTILPFFNSSSP